jgi:3',5'-cyclic AMP phosphodiesterase CpdA
MPYILHLSDLHLSAGDDQGVIGDYRRDVIPPAERKRRRHALEATLRGLARWLRMQRATLDAVIVTGNVTYQYQEAGFEQLEQVLSNLGDRLPPPGRVLVVPGNNDVAWGTAPGSRERYDRFIRYVRERGGHVTPLLEGIDLTANDPPSSVNPLLLSTDGSYLVVALNSSNYAGVVERLPGINDQDLEELGRRANDNAALRRTYEELLRLRVADIARLSPVQLRAVGSLLDGLPPASEEGPIRMVALHHQLLPVSSSEEIKPYESITNPGEVRDFLRNNEIDVVLHGHKHVGRLYWDYPETDGAEDATLLEPSAGRPILVSSCGTIGVRDELATLIEVPERRPDQPPSRRIRVIRVPSLAVGVRTPEGFPTTMVSLPVRGSRRTRSPAILLEGQTVSEVYAQLRERFDDLTDGGRLHNLVCHVAEGPSGLELPAGYPEISGHADLGRWFVDTVAWWQRDRSRLKGRRFTHGERLRRFGLEQKVDQLADCAITIRGDPGTGRAIATLVDPIVDRVTDRSLKFPCFTTLQFVVVESSVLDCIVYFRLQELRFWWPINVAEIAFLQRLMTERLRADGLPLRSGAIMTITAIAHTSDAPPNVLVPLVDQLVEDDRGRLWSMAHALFWTDIPDREGKLDDWERILEDWLPGEQGDPIGAPVPVDGLRELADQVGWLVAERGSSRGRSVVDALERMIEANEDYLQSELRGLDRLEAYARWRLRTLANARRLLEAVEAMR